jgi:hypothetical protein
MMMMMMMTCGLVYHHSSSERIKDLSHVGPACAISNGVRTFNSSVSSPRIDLTAEIQTPKNSGGIENRRRMTARQRMIAVTVLKYRYGTFEISTRPSDWRPP